MTHERWVAEYRCKSQGAFWLWNVPFCYLPWHLVPYTLWNCTCQCQRCSGKLLKPWGKTEVKATTSFLNNCFKGSFFKRREEGRRDKWKTGNGVVGGGEKEEKVVPAHRQTSEYSWGWGRKQQQVAHTLQARYRHTTPALVSCNIVLISLLVVWLGRKTAFSWDEVDLEARFLLSNGQEWLMTVTQVYQRKAIFFQ